MKPKRLVALLLLTALLVGFGSVGAARAEPSAAIGLDGTTTYTQDFNTLAASGTTNSTIPEGWAFSETGANANITYAANSGSDNAGNTYSYGTGTDSERALGGLRSSNLVPTIGAQFQNTHATLFIRSLTITYTGEQWRFGELNRNAADRLDFQYSTDATSLSTGTWTDVDALDFSSPITTGAARSLDGNAAANRTSISGQITGLVVPPGGTFWIRWTDFNVSGADDGLAIDDFSIPNVVLAVTLNAFDAAQQQDGTTLVNWQTASELDTVGFNVWRSADVSAPTERLNAALIPALASGTPQGASYEFSDATANGTAYYYWLEDIDVNGQSTLHGPVLAQPQVPTAVTLTDVRTSPSGHGLLLALGVASVAAVAGLLRRRRR